MATLGFAAAGWYYANEVAIPKYTAQAAVTLEKQPDPIVDLQSVVSGTSTDQASINTEIEVLRSPDLIEKLVDKMNLVEDPEFNPFLTDEAPRPGAQRQLDATVQRVSNAITIANTRSSYVFTLTVVTESPEKSAAMANAFAEVYISEQVATKYEAMENAAQWLSDRVASLKFDLEEAENKVKDFSANAELVSGEGLSIVNAQIKELRDRTMELDVTRAVQADRLKALRAAGANRNQALILRAQSELDSTVSQIEALDGTLKDLETNYAAQSGDVVELRQLEREAESVRGLYEFFLNRFQETSVQRGTQRPDSTLLYYARVPASPSEPRTPLVIALAGLLGLMVGSGGVLLREMMQTVFRSAEDVEAETRLPVLGQLPNMPRRNRKRLLKYLVNKPTSLSAESVRNLRTSVSTARPDGGTRVIQLCSSLPGEGKTTTAIALAQSFSSLGKSVLLIEGDMRRRVFSKYFNVTQGKGLHSVLDRSARFSDVIHRSNVIGADVLLAEKSTKNSADVFASPHFATFIRFMRRHYDHIIIDTPPVLLVPDARIAGSVADEILLVIKWDTTTRAQVREAIREFSVAGVAITGAVLNQIDPVGMKRYGYSSGYASYGHRGYYAS